jgi:hypothetical protein
MRRLAKSEDIEAVFSIYAHEEVVPFLTYEPMSLDEFQGIYGELVSSRCFCGNSMACSPASTGRLATQAGCGTSPCLEPWR